MKQTRRKFVRFNTAALVMAMIPVTVAQSGGWFKAGSHPSDYDMGTDVQVAYTGKSSGYLRSKKPEPQGFGTYMQSVDASEYRGKRLRLSCFVKAEKVEDWAGVWMRVDREQKGIAFDNMQNRPIKGTQIWTKHDVVLDVDSKATNVAFGILLSGKGAVWIDDVNLEVVGDQVPVTAMKIRSEAPKNLDFEAESQKR